MPTRAKPATRHSALVLGMMSGTSLDGIDAALVKISGAPPHLQIDLINHTHLPFAPEVRQEILRVAEQNPLTPGEFSRLHGGLGHVYAEAALAACRKFRIPPGSVDLIGNHGQTVFHQGPGRAGRRRQTGTRRGAGFLSLPSTLQLGDGSVIAARTGITTVSDFRPADVALGGQGAPLVPFADYALYRHSKLGRVSLNIGGISNVTVIPANATPAQVSAFDTGPGNMLIDALVQRFTNSRQRFDEGAVLAKCGSINCAIMSELLREPYLKQKPPKSTGREYFGANYVEKLLALGRRYRASSSDLVHTVTAFTAASVVDALRRFVFPQYPIDEIIVSGGGVRNPLLFELLSRFLGSAADPAGISRPAGARPATALAEKLRGGHGFISLLPSERFHIPADAKEALAFAILAYETSHHRPSNVPSATGASGPAILGKISYASPR